jgi:hypothetical protein
MMRRALFLVHRRPLRQLRLQLAGPCINPAVAVGQVAIISLPVEPEV